MITAAFSARKSITTWQVYFYTSIIEFYFLKEENEFFKKSRLLGVSKEGRKKRCLNVFDQKR